MKRVLEILTVILVIFIVTGALIIANKKGTLQKNENFFSFIFDNNNEEKELTKEFEVTDDNMIFNVDSSNCSIEVVGTDNSNIEVKCVYYGNVNFTANKNSNEIEIKSSKERSSFFNWNSKRGQVIIYVPKSIVGEYYLDTSNGIIAFSDVKVNDIEGETSNSAISLSNVEGKNKIEISTSNGRINIDNVRANEIIADSSNGSVKINNVKGELLEIDTSNGGINADEVYCEGISFNTSNGSVHLNNIEDKEYVIDKIQVSTSNGSKDINANYKVLK